MSYARKSIALVTLFTLAGPAISAYGKDGEEPLPSTRAPAWMNLPDLADQFIGGEEPTHTTYRILFENLLAILQKLFLRTGKGVLTIETKSNLEFRLKYLDLVRDRCPECTISEFRESHGTKSYWVAFPDGSGFGVSLDAGAALEFQTTPQTLLEKMRHRQRRQMIMFDLPREAGATGVLKSLHKMLGGHYTQSGYGGDTAWWAANLIIDANTPEFDRGFFGKDTYNANPVRRWLPEQQIKYASVLSENDRQWEKFLRTLEASFADGREPDLDELLALFETREVKSEKEFADALASIYFNPGPRPGLIGKRSKTKYVADRPAPGIIERRAINPQQNVLELEQMGLYRLRLFEYLRAKLDAGLGLTFVPGFFRDLSDNDTCAQAKVYLEDLGLNWADYAHFGKVANPKPTGREKHLAEFFHPVAYGPKTRDELYDRVLARFRKKGVWNEREWHFMLQLIRERGTTLKNLRANLPDLVRRVSDARFESLPLGELEIRIHALSQIVEKFPSLSPSAADALEPVIRPSLEVLRDNGRNIAVSPWMKHFSPETLKRWAVILQENLRRHPSSRLLDLQSRVILHADQKAGIDPTLVKGWVKDWFTALGAMPPDSLQEIPQLLMKMAERLGLQFVDLHANAYRNLADAVTRLPIAAFRESDGEVLHLLAEIFPARESEIMLPFRTYALGELEKIGYGLEEHYHAKVLIEEVLAATPAREKDGVTRMVLARVKAMHAVKNDPDSQSLLQDLRWSYYQLQYQKCVHFTGSPYFKLLKELFFGKSV